MHVHLKRMLISPLLGRVFYKGQLGKAGYESCKSSLSGLLSVWLSYQLARVKGWNLLYLQISFIHLSVLTVPTSCIESTVVMHKILHYIHNFKKSSNTSCSPNLHPHKLLTVLRTCPVPPWLELIMHLPN